MANINYELAKKLKEAGFPQNPHNYHESPNQGFDEDGGLRDFHPWDAYNPTLSELIEACPLCYVNSGTKIENNFRLEFYKDGTWHAGYGTDEDPLIPKECSGKTKEEAVANLWLTLNKKDNG